MKGQRKGVPQRYHRFHRSSEHVWQGRFKSPVIQDDEHLLTVLRYIEANPVRAKLVEHAGEYRWSSFACHGNGSADLLVDTTPAYEAFGIRPATRQQRWSAHVHRTPDADELAAIRRSGETGLPYDERSWVDRLAKRLKLDLAIRPRGRPRKAALNE